MSSDVGPSLNHFFLEELCLEVSDLKGDDLDQFLLELGLSPDEILNGHSEAIDAAMAAEGRARFENARLVVQRGKSRPSFRLLTFDGAKKREILRQINMQATMTGSVTIAARNKKIDAAEDLDSFLEACCRLGIIDEDGNLKA
jgi:hypothetical protein